MNLVLVVVAIAVVQSPAADTLRLLAQRLPQSALVLEVRSRPLAVRDAVTDALRSAVSARTSAVRDQHLAVARGIAAAAAAGWRDSFLVREVERFAARGPDFRAGKIWVDSVRRAGNVAYRRDGPSAAIATWRKALRRARAIRDSAGSASVMGNIGAAFLEEGRLDSASAYLERARVLATAIGDLSVVGNAVGMLAGVSADRGDIATARVQYAEALALRERIGDSRGVAADHNNLGLLAQQLGDLDEARDQFDAALALNRRDGRDDVAATNLVNLAGLASLAGDFKHAAVLYRDALATWRAREEWADAAAALQGLGQLEIRRGDYPAAVEALEEALTLYDRTGPATKSLEVLRQLAGALAGEGNMQEALAALRRAEQRADSMGAPAEARAGIALARADLAAQWNASADAERWFARAEFLYRQAGNRSGEAEAQEGRGVLLTTRGEFARAQTLLEAAVRAQQAGGNPRSAALARMSLAHVSFQRGDTLAARAQLSRSIADLERLRDPVGAAAALGERATLEAEAGFPAVAESLFTAGLSRLQRRVAPEVSWRLHAGLGLTLRARDDDEEAARELRAAIGEIERASRSILLPERRAAFLMDKWDVYAQLALTEQRRGYTNAAFEAAEQLRSRQMLELLARGRIGDGDALDTAASLVAREQDLRRRIAELTHQVAEDAEELRGVDASSTMTRDGLARAQDAYAELLLEMRERAPRHAALLALRTASLRDVQERLAPADAFVEFLISDSGSLAFVITRDSVAVRDLGSRRRELARLVEFARGTLVRPGSGVTDSLWRGPLRQLHQRLIAPIEETGLLNGKTRLLLVPQAELHYLPFAALLDSAHRFLIERYELATTPSASVWLALGDRPQRSTAGVLALAPRPDALPASRREVAFIERRAKAEGRVLVGAGATESAFRREAPASRVIHLATLGVLNKNNPLFSFVQLESGDGEDGRLDVHEVFGLNLAADLVVLSACQTGLGSGALSDVPPGDDWVGLTRAFLHAGAAHVIATLWQVDDWATAAVMEQFYTRYGLHGDPATALAAAQRTILRASGTKHPFYWAGFTAVSGSGTAGLAP